MEEKASVSPQGAGDVGRCPSVLVVGGPAVAAALAHTTLWKEEIRRAFARDGAEATEVARAQRPALVVLEFGPETVDLVKRLRASSETRCAAIVALRGDAGPQDEELLRQAGVNVIVPSPVNALVWDARLQELSTARRRRELRVPVQLVTWSQLADGPPVEGLALNISLHGMLLETPVALEVGSKLDLALRLPDEPEELSVVGQVVRFAGVEARRPLSGIKFLVHRGDAQERIRRFVHAEAEALAGGARAETSEQEQWERELRTADAARLAVLDWVADGVVTLDEEGRIVECNRAAERTLCYARAELVGMIAVDKLAPPALVERQRRALARCVAGDSSILGRRFEIQVRRGDGSELPVEIVITLVSLRHRRFLTACFRDIKERKQAEESLRASAKQFRVLFEGALDAMVVTDDAGRYVEMNPAACALHGLGREKLLGRRMGDFAQEEAGFGREWAAPPATGSAKREFRLARPDGSLRDVEFVTNADFIHGGHLLVLRDVTEHRSLEEQFRKAQKMEAVGRLAGGVAHDFNNLLSVIGGYAELLHRNLGTDDPRRRKTLEILKATERATALTRQLLAFSRKQVLQPRVFDLNAVVSDVKNMLGRLIGEDVEIATDLDPELGAVRADPGQIEQVLTNLVVNARDAMPDGGQIRIDTRNADLDPAYADEHLGARPGRYVRLQVQDEGMGMDEATQRHIFEPFFTTKGLGKGTGLGLATVYGIVKQSGGYIWVESQPGQGATFQVFLPRVDAHAEATAPAKPGEEPFSESRRDANILLVEDEDMLRAMTQELLEGQGYRVLAARNGSEALDLVGRHASAPIDLLLTDLIMPGMRGSELARRLAPLLPGIKVLYTSGYTNDAVFSEGSLEPGSAFLQKPYTAAALARAIRGLLDPDGH